MSIPRPITPGAPEGRLSLDALMSPRSVALIGASEKPASVGISLLQNLRGFPGRFYPVNPEHSTVCGLPCYPTVASLPEEVDLAIIATPAASVPGIVRECRDAGVAAVVVISAGFKECGLPGAALESQILQHARAGNIRVVGPNCLGLTVPRVGLNATFATTAARPGSVAFISQSGALGAAVLDWSERANVGFSAFVSVGSMLDVGWHDLIDYFGDDPHTHSIVIYMETIGDARAFLSAAHEVALSKPIIVVKVGRTASAARAAATHTGSLVGDDDVLDAAFRRAGVLRVDAIEELFDMAGVLAKQPRPRGPRLAIVTNAGGPGALAADALVAAQGELASLSDQSMAALDQLLPMEWSHGNPIDVLGDASAERFAKAFRIAIDDPASDGVLAILTPQAMTDPAATAGEIAAAAHGQTKPILATWMGGARVEAGEKLLNEAGIPAFKYPDRAARAFAYMWRYSANLKALYETPIGEMPSGQSRENTERIISQARHTGRVLLSEFESKAILSEYGIPVVETRIAETEEAAIVAASELGYPVVLKLHSTTISHKSSVKGVHLDLRQASDVSKAWHAIYIAAQAEGRGAFLGVTVQPYISPSGCELILGSSIDSQFGPVLLFGTGGTQVEVHQDHALGLPPLNSTLARRLMEMTRIYQALRGTAGRPLVDIQALAQLLVRFSQLVADQRMISSIDINPLQASSDRLLALDARIVLHPVSLPLDQVPRLAIRPYPVQYVTSWDLRSGAKVSVRPIRPEDEPAMVEFHRTLSSRSVYSRYFTALGLEQRIAHNRLSRLCCVDYDRVMVLVVEASEPISGAKPLMAIGRLTRVRGTNTAEFAILVSDKWQGHGLGKKLLAQLVQIGRVEGLSRITGDILSDNAAMKAVSRQVGFRLKADPDGDSCTAEMDLVST